MSSSASPPDAPLSHAARRAARLGLPHAANDLATADAGAESVFGCATSLEMAVA